MSTAVQDETEASAGRRRGSSRHRSDRLATLPGWLAWIVRRGIAFISLLPALIAVAVVQTLSPAAQQVPEGLARFELGGAWLAWPLSSLYGYDLWWTAPPFGWIQLGALLHLLQAGSAQSVLAAAHGAMLLVTLADTALLWLLLRRGGASGLAAGASAAVFGIVPAAIDAHTAVAGTAVAVLWLLAAAVLLSFDRIWTAVVGGLLAGLAVITAPVTLLVVAALIAHLLLPRTDRRPGVPTGTRSIAAVVSVLAVLAASRIVAGVLAAQTPTRDGLLLAQVGRAAASAQWGLGTAAPTDWLMRDPLTLLLFTAAVVLVAPTRAFRPLVVLAVLLAVAAFWPLGTDRVAPVLLLLPVTAVAVAAVIDRAVGALGEPAFRRSVVGSAWLTGVAAVLTVAAVAWLLSLTGLQRPQDQPVARAASWIRDSVPDRQVVLVDLGLWPDLSRDRALQVGWYAATPGGTVSSVPWRDADYVLAGPSFAEATTGIAQSGRPVSLPVAGFGSGAGHLEVRAVQHATATPSPTSTPTRTRSAAEQRAAAARVSTGSQLAENPRITLSGSDRAALRAGDVDSRVAIVLAQFVTEHRIVVASFPATKDDGGVRREVVISSVDGHRIPSDGTATGTLLRYLSSLRGQYAAQSIDATDEGLLTTFAVDPTFVP